MDEEKDWLSEQTERLVKLAAAREQLQGAISSLAEAQQFYEDALSEYQRNLREFDNGLPEVYFECRENEHPKAVAIVSNNVVPPSANLPSDEFLLDVLSVMAYGTNKLMDELKVPARAFAQVGAQLQRLKKAGFIEQTKNWRWRAVKRNGEAKDNDSESHSETP